MYLNPYQRLVSLIALLLPGILVGASAASGKTGASRKADTPPPSVDFVRDVQPLLKAHCYECHGPSQKQAGLRFDMRSSALEGGVSGKAIVPGKSADSLLMRRILGQGGKPRMPLGLGPLSNADIDKLRAWIDQGATWPDSAAIVKHWAFIPPNRPALPVVHLNSWPRNPIDAFVLAKMEKEGLKPSPEADRTTLIRRVSLDLTGIPPTPAEVDAFAADKSPNAYEKVVDRLLASPQYGERMAVDWLDGARYADSNGYQADYERYQWPWRDWVINAFNRNIPYDQFIVKQLAGDLLPNATVEDKLATGFNRNHRVNTEGGVIPEEWRVETVIDRVETTSEVFLGLTMGCARCHDHKYDPITQKDFYSFYSFFNNVSETGTGPEVPANVAPVMKVPTPEYDQRLADLDARHKQIEAWIDARLTTNAAAAANWKLDDGKAADTSLLNGLVARYRLSSQPAVAAGSGPQPTLVGTVAADAGHATGAVITGNGSYVDLGQVGDFDTKDAFSYGAWVNPANGEGSPLSKMDKSADYRGWDIYLTRGRPAIHLINQWPGNALKIVSKRTIPNDQWTHVLMTYDGSAKPEGLKLYLDGKPVAFDVEVNALTGTLRTPVSAKIGTRTGADAFAGKVDDVVLYKRVLAADEVLRLMEADPAKTLLAVAPDKRTEEQKREITRLWSERNDAEYQKQSAERDAVAKEQADLDKQMPTAMVMEEMPKPRECHILIRGQYDKPGDVVTAAIPAYFGTLPPGTPNNRLGLAEWIASPSNPLTARVAVNRFWEKLFGAGIVRTGEDFGTRAEPPTHPELLDWLATEFVRLKWDMKAMQKEMVMSATYRQSSHVSPEMLAKDPENRLLERGPRFRLPAEVIRDQALAASGLLVEKIGGPSVRPYQPPGIWDEVSVYGNLHNYKHDTGDGLYRRSLYTIWKRTAAPPEMTIFDVPSREICTIRRSRTDTPLQALVLMDDETYTEAARVLAQRMLTEGGATTADRITYAFRRVLCRRPGAQELQVLTAGLQRRLAKYRADPADAAKLVSVGDAPRDPNLNVADLAAYTMTASIVLNMDETVTKE